jgi:hypothetical protein
MAHRLALPVQPPIAPMLAELARDLPNGDGWLDAIDTETKQIVAAEAIRRCARHHLPSMVAQEQILDTTSLRGVLKSRSS